MEGHEMGEVPRSLTGAEASDGVLASGTRKRSGVSGLLRAGLAAGVVGVMSSAVLVAGGCGNERPLNVVKMSGDRAMERGNHEDALGHYSEWVKRDPSNSRARLSYARALRAVGRQAHAREQLWVAYSLDLNNREIFDELTSTLMASGDHDQLIELLRQRTIDRGAFEDYERLSSYLLRLGDPDEAERALLVGARVDGGRSVGPQLALADFYSTIGDRGNELLRLRMAHYLDPQNEVIARRIRNLGEIPGPTFTLVPTEAGGVP